MISVVDDALRAIVRNEVVSGSDVEVLFDAPTKDWAARRNAPTVNSTSTTSGRTRGDASTA